MSRVWREGRCAALSFNFVLVDAVGGGGCKRDGVGQGGFGRGYRWVAAVVARTRIIQPSQAASNRAKQQRTNRSKLR